MITRSLKNTQVVSLQFVSRFNKTVFSKYFLKVKTACDPKKFPEVLLLACKRLRKLLAVTRDQTCHVQNTLNNINEIKLENILTRVFSYKWIFLIYFFFSSSDQGQYLFLNFSNIRHHDTKYILYYLYLWIFLFLKKRRCLFFLDNITLKLETKFIFSFYDDYY